MLDRMTCISLQKLTAGGFSLQDAMDVAENGKVRPVFEDIRRQLEEGGNIADIFVPYCPRAYRAYFAGFIRYLSFSGSLTVSVSIAEEEEKRKAEMVKGLLYPAVLSAGVMCGMLLFSMFVMPGMLKLLAGFQIECGGYELMRKAAVFLSVSGLSAGAAVLCYAAYRLQPEKIRETYSFIARRFPDSLLTQYASAEFIRFYLAFMKVSPSTYECMNVLKNLTCSPLVSMIAETIDAELTKGQSFENALTTPYIEKALLRFFRIAFHTADPAEMMEGYLAMTEERKRAQLKRITLTVQLISYAAVGIVLIAVYRILMIPMTMIQQI